MDKEEIIKAIENLYERLSDKNYDHWYKRDTMLKWEDSYEYEETRKDQEERLENSLQ